MADAAVQTPHPETRPSWDEYFMMLAEEVATRTTCLRRGVGAVIVKDRRILATGYNGVPTGCAHCAETGCRAERHHPGGPLRHQHRRRHYLRQHPALRGVREDAHQRRHQGNRVQEPLSRPALPGHTGRNRHPGTGVRWRIKPFPRNARKLLQQKRWARRHCAPQRRAVLTAVRPAEQKETTHPAYCLNIGLSTVANVFRARIGPFEMGLNGTQAHEGSEEKEGECCRLLSSDSLRA